VGASVDKAALRRRHGVQVTAQRLVVVRAVSDRPHSAAKIAAVVRSEIGAVSLQAVYDAIATITDKGIIRRIQPGGVGGAVQGPSRQQPPPSGLPNLQPSGRWRLCHRQDLVSDSCRELGLRDRRSRGHIGPSRLRRGGRCRVQSDRVPIPRNNLSETALDLTRRASARTDHHRNETVST